jgi:hypothetical protein
MLLLLHWPALLPAALLAALPARLLLWLPTRALALHKQIQSLRNPAASVDLPR